MRGVRWACRWSLSSANRTPSVIPYWRGTSHTLACGNPSQATFGCRNIHESTSILSAAQSRPLDSLPARRVGQQHTHQEEPRPDPLYPTQFPLGSGRPDRFVQHGPISVDEWQGIGNNDGLSSRKTSFSPLPSSGKNLKIK